MPLLLTTGCVALGPVQIGALARVEDEDGLLYSSSILSDPWSTSISETGQSPTLIKIEGAPEGYLAERVRLAVDGDGTSDLRTFDERGKVQELAVKIPCTCRVGGTAMWHAPTCAKQAACQRP